MVDEVATVAESPEEDDANTCMVDIPVEVEVEVEAEVLVIVIAVKVGESRRIRLLQRPVSKRLVIKVDGLKIGAVIRLLQRLAT